MFYKPLILFDLALLAKMVSEGANAQGASALSNSTYFTPVPRRITLLGLARSLGCPETSGARRDKGPGGR